MSIPTDGAALDGLLYEPRDRPAIGCVQLMHGNGMNFYVGPPRFLVPHLVARGFACLAYNRRGHDILSTRDSRRAEGNAFQTAAESIADNRFASAWLAERGYGAPAVIGHSHGGVLAVRHVADDPETPCLVLLSAHRGGDFVRVASGHGLLARDQLPQLTERARGLAAEGRGDTLMLLPGWWYAITARSLLDLMTNTPGLLELAPRIRCRTLFLRGAEEPPDLYPAEEFRARAGGHVEVRVLDDCDHFYNGAEAITGELVGDWLASVVTNRAGRRSDTERPPPRPGGRTAPGE